MEQLTVLGLILALISGLVGIALLVRLLHLYPLRFLRALLYCLLWFNLLVVLGIAFRYLEFHLADLLSSEWELALKLIILDLMAALKLVFLLAFVEASALVTGRDLGDRFKKGYWVVAGTWLILLILTTVIALAMGSPTAASLAHSLFEFFIFLGLLTTVFYYVLPSFRPGPKGPRTASKIFFAMHLLIFSAGLASVLFASVLGTSGLWQIQLVNTLVMFSYNSLLTTWAFRYIPVLESVLEVESGIPRDISGRLERFGITNREREVIELICQGKSNQEIADCLFISLQTVKDHVYSIFQKTGVKNRVHLANLWRG